MLQDITLISIWHCASLGPSAVRAVTFSLERTSRPSPAIAIERIVSVSLSRLGPALMGQSRGRRDQAEKDNDAAHETPPVVISRKMLILSRGRVKRRLTPFPAARSSASLASIQAPTVPSLRCSRFQKGARAFSGNPSGTRAASKAGGGRWPSEPARSSSAGTICRTDG